MVQHLDHALPVLDRFGRKGSFVANGQAGPERIA